MADLHLIVVLLLDVFHFLLMAHLVHLQLPLVLLLSLKQLLLFALHLHSEVLIALLLMLTVHPLAIHLLLGLLRLVVLLVVSLVGLVGLWIWLESLLHHLLGFVGTLALLLHVLLVAFLEIFELLSVVVFVLCDQVLQPVHVRLERLDVLIVLAVELTSFRAHARLGVLLRWWRRLGRQGVHHARHVLWSTP